MTGKAMPCSRSRGRRSSSATAPWPLRPCASFDGLPAPPPAPGAKIDIRAWERFAAVAESASVRRDAGDLEGARAALDRAARSLESLDRRGVLRDVIDRMGRELDAAVADKHPEIAMNEEEEVVGEAATILLDQYIALGDMDRARALIRRLLAYVGPPRGSMRTAMTALIGGYLARAGDPEGGRQLIERARKAALELRDPQALAFALPLLAQSMFEAGDLDAVLALFRDWTPPQQSAVIVRILDQLAKDDQSAGWYDPAGIAIKIGTPSLSPKDPARTRAILPRIVAAVQTVGDARVRARTLATIAHLQARAGDVPGALATVRAIPDLKRSDFPGPSDGFYDAVKPAAMALVAGLQGGADDRAGAAVTLDEAEALARAVAADDQKLIAQIVIAAKWASCARPDSAKATIAEALAVALNQPEPRRSRVLTMLAEDQIQAGDRAGALRTIDAIRAYPGLEKARAMSVLARSYEQSGDTAASGDLLRRAAACLEAGAPTTPLSGKVQTLNVIGRDTFVDFDLELDPAHIAFQRASMRQGLRARAGDVDAAVRDAKSLDARRRDPALSQIVGTLAYRGNLARAMELAASIESPDARLSAFMTITHTLGTDQAAK